MMRKLSRTQADYALWIEKFAKHIGDMEDPIAVICTMEVALQWLREDIVENGTMAGEHTADTEKGK